MQTKWVVEIFFLEFLNLSMSEEDSHLKSLYFMKYVYESFLYKQTQNINLLLSMKLSKILSND